MIEAIALRASEEVSEQVCAGLLDLRHDVSPRVAASVALATVAGAARAYRRLAETQETDLQARARLAAAVGSELAD